MRFNLQNKNPKKTFKKNIKKKTRKSDHIALQGFWMAYSFKEENNPGILLYFKKKQFY